MQRLLDKLYQGKILSTEQSRTLFSAIMAGKLDAIPLSAVLCALKVRGEQPSEIAGAVQAVLDHARDFPRPDYLFADIVGTGGDGTNSINISTASAFVAAAAGYKVAKHGNRSVSSQTGSSDLLHALGINPQPSAVQSRQMLDELDLCFLFAPHYHPGFSYVAEVRRQLKTRTVFNILGPLCNPARPEVALIGVYSPHLLKPVVESLQSLAYRHAIVVHGSGMDEVAIHGPTQVAELKHGKIDYYQVEPADFGVQRHSQQSLAGGSAHDNSLCIQRLLQGHGDLAHQHAIACNVAMLMTLFGPSNLQDNANHAMHILASGKAYQLVKAMQQRDH